MVFPILESLVSKQERRLYDEQYCTPSHPRSKYDQNLKRQTENYDTHCKHAAMPDPFFLFSHPVQTFLLERKQCQLEVSWLLCLGWDDDRDVLRQVTPNVSQFGMVPS